MSREKINKWIDNLFFLALLSAASAVTILLFYWQSISNVLGQYPSDMKAYVLEIQGLNTLYSYPYPIFFKIAQFISLFEEPEFSIALTTMLLNGLAMVIIKYFFNHMALERLENSLTKCKWLAGMLISLVSISLFFISMLFLPEGIYLPGIKYRYLGVFTGNPFHNATYMAARPFAVLAFFQYVKLLDCYEQGYGGKWCRPQSGVAMKDYVLFSLFLLLATMTKPSFTLVMVGTAGLIMLYRLFRSGFHNFVPTMQLGLCFIPTFLDLLYQYRGVFVPQEGMEGGIGFCFGEVWRVYCGNIPLSVVLAIGFPIAVLVCHIKQLKEIWKGNTLYRFSWQLYGMSFPMTFFLYEKGFRKPDFNFSWGYMYGIFFCFVGSLPLLLKDTADVVKTSRDKAVPKTATRFWFLPKLLLGAQWAVYLWHLACGLYYFRNFMQGKMYY